MNELQSLRNIFKDGIFKIPDYQRGYAWSPRQLKDFWEDLVNLQPGKNHYTGVLSLRKVDQSVWKTWTEERWLVEERDYKPFHVVDGQQRLTTFVVFIQTIYELLKSLPENDNQPDSDIYLGTFNLKEIREEYLVVRKPPQNIISTYKFGYEIDNPSFEYLKYKIYDDPGGGTVQETFYTLNLQNAKNFFSENLTKYYKDNGLDAIEALYRKLTQNMMFNVYEISDDYDVFVAFETMNNRGKRLSNLELLKNRLIYLTTLFQENELRQDERSALRRIINDAWKEVYYQLGRNKQNPLNDDEFLVAHWIMYYQYTRQKGDDYIRFLLESEFTPRNIYLKTDVQLSTLQEYEEVRESDVVEEEEAEQVDEDVVVRQSKLKPSEIKKYVHSLKESAVHWYNIHNPINNDSLTEPESLWLDRLHRIGWIYFRPLITASYLSENTTVDDMINLMKAVERFIFVAFRLSRAYSTYRNSEFFKYARRLRQDKDSVGDIIKMLETRMSYCFTSSSDSKETYYDYTFFRKFLEKKFKSDGGYYYWSDLKYLLYEYEWSKVRERGSQKIDWKLFTKSEKDKVSIEHIYPQTPTHEYWTKRFAGEGERERKYLSGSLGNLLPLSMSINSSLQNDSFDDKRCTRRNEKGDILRHGYSNGSHSEIEVSQYAEWNPESIYQRGLKILQFMEERWSIKFESESAMADLLFLEFMHERTTRPDGEAENGN